MPRRPSLPSRGKRLDMSIGVPALLFPAISLLLLAYTNRYLGLSTVIRTLYADYQLRPDPKIVKQLVNLRRRVRMIRSMQAMGVGSMLLCVLSMFFIYFGQQHMAHGLFGISLLIMVASLTMSILEIWISTDSLTILLADIEEALAVHERH